MNNKFLGNELTRLNMVTCQLKNCSDGLLATKTSADNILSVTGSEQSSQHFAPFYGVLFYMLGLLGPWFKPSHSLSLLFCNSYAEEKHTNFTKDGSTATNSHAVGEANSNFNFIKQIKSTTHCIKKRLLQGVESVVTSSLVTTTATNNISSITGSEKVELALCPFLPSSLLYIRSLI